MKLILKLSQNSTPIDFDYKYKLMSCFQKWINDSEIHDSTSLYTFSNIRNCKVINNKLHTTRNSEIIFSAYDNELLIKIITNIQKDNILFNGIEVTEIQTKEQFVNKDCFFALSSIICSPKFDTNHYTYLDKEVNQKLLESMLWKMKITNVKYDLQSIKFDLSKNPKTKLYVLKQSKYRATECPILIKGCDKAKEFCLNVGVGNRTGFGFGCLG